MKMLEVESMLKDLRKARERWGQGRTEFFSGYDWVLTRLIHEGVVNYMGANQIAAALGVSPKTIRAKMRSIGLDPRGGKRALNAKASQAMLENAAIMGVDPSEMDLTSPLAYLPMGEELRKQYQDRTLARVTELEDEPFDFEAWVTKDENSWFDERTEEHVVSLDDLREAMGGRPVSGNTRPDVNNGATLDVLRERGGAILRAKGQYYDIRVQEIDGRRYLHVEDAALLLGDNSHWPEA